MSVIDDLVARGFGGYVGWDPKSAAANFQATGGQGKQTQNTPPGYQFSQQPQGQVLGASTGPMGQPQQNVNPLGQAYDWAVSKANQIGQGLVPMAANITQAFGIKSPYDVFSNNINTGTDLAVPVGTPVIVPTGRWRVVQSFNGAQRPGYIGDRTNSGYGNSVMLQNLDTGEKLRFSHLSQVGVKTGEIVGGQPVGLSGATGNVTGPHLDVEYYDKKGQLSDVMKSPYLKDKIMAMNNPQTLPQTQPDFQTQQAGEMTKSAQPKEKPPEPIISQYFIPNRKANQDFTKTFFPQTTSPNV